MNVDLYLLDLAKDKEGLINYLKARGTTLNIEEQLANNSIFLANQFDDIWFWDFDLVNFFYGDILE